MVSRSGLPLSDPIRVGLLRLTDPGHRQFSLCEVHVTLRSLCVLFLSIALNLQVQISELLDSLV